MADLTGLPEKQREALFSLAGEPVQHLSVHWDEEADMKVYEETVKKRVTSKGVRKKLNLTAFKILLTKTSGLLSMLPGSKGWS